MRVRWCTHSCNTQAQGTIHVLCFQALFCFNWPEKCDGGSTTIRFLFGGWGCISSRDILHSLWHPFQSSPGGAAGVSCVSSEASQRPGRCAVQLAVGVDNGLQLWCRCEEAAENAQSVGLISVPPGPGWVPSHHLLNQRLKRDRFIYYVYILRDKILLNQPSAKYLEVTSFPCHGLYADPRRGELLPRTPDTALIFFGIYFVGRQRRGDICTMKPHKKLQEPIHIQPLKDKMELVICP